MDIAKLKAAYAATTPGEWRPIAAVPDGIPGVTIHEGDRQSDVCYVMTTRADAAFIAMAQNMAPSIIEALETYGNRAEPGETEQIRRGELLAEVLGLKQNREGRYLTTWGDKTSLGLFLTIKRIIEQGE